MSLKQLIIKFFPSLYIQKNFSFLKTASFSNYREKNIEPELLLLKYLLEPGKNFIDVGSNKGLFLYMASRITKPALIYGFEPNPILYKKIRNVFKKVSLLNCALSAKSGTATLSVPFTNAQPDDSLASISQGQQAGSAHNFEVELKKLDDFKLQSATGLIKIDVEGHELDVIKGAEQLIKKEKPVLIVEIEQRHHRQPVKEIVDDLCEVFGYDAYYFLPKDNRLVSFSAEPKVYQESGDFGTIHYVNNFIFIHPTGNSDQLVTKINSEIGKK